jgi:hypothetical protein
MMSGDREFAIRKRLATDFEFYAANCLSIRSKNGIIPFILNRAQKYLLLQIEEQLKRKGRVRLIILKGRQVGGSTFINGRNFQITTHKRGIRTFILTHQDQATANLYEIVRRFYDNCPENVKPQAGTHNAKELSFPALDSGYKIGTAGSQSLGRSSTIQLFHWSEMAFSPYAEDHFAGIMQAIPMAGYSESIIESTANGQENHFYYLWQMAASRQSDYECCFLPWYWDDQYALSFEGEIELTDEEDELMQIYGLTARQIYWRRLKIIELSGAGRDGAMLFKQEYPCCAEEAFILTGGERFIDPNIVERAAKGKAEAYGPLVIGVDPAWEGKDETAIIKRRGRVAYDLMTYQGMDPMDVVNEILKCIRNDMPEKIFIDIVGLGGPIISRLRELGYGKIVMPVNAASTPLNKTLYKAKDGENWDLMKQWLLDEPVSIPDDPKLKTQLCSRGYKYKEIDHKLYLQSKSELRISPDCADALSFTFSYPVYSTNEYDKMYTTTRMVGGLE